MFNSINRVQSCSLVVNSSFICQSLNVEKRNLFRDPQITERLSARDLKKTKIYFALDEDFASWINTRAKFLEGIISAFSNVKRD